MTDKRTRVKTATDDRVMVWLISKTTKLLWAEETVRGGERGKEKEEETMLKEKEFKERLKRRRARQGAEIGTSRITNQGGGNGSTKYEGSWEKGKEGCLQILKELNG